MRLRAIEPPHEHDGDDAHREEQANLIAGGRPCFEDERGRQRDGVQADGFIADDDIAVQEVEAAAIEVLVLAYGGLGRGVFDRRSGRAEVRVLGVVNVGEGAGERRAFERVDGDVGESLQLRGWQERLQRAPDEDGAYDLAVLADGAGRIQHVSAVRLEDLRELVAELVVPVLEHVLHNLPFRAVGGVVFQRRYRQWRRRSRTASRRCARRWRRGSRCALRPRSRRSGSRCQPARTHCRQRRPPALPSVKAMPRTTSRCCRSRRTNESAVTRAASAS